VTEKVADDAGTIDVKPSNDPSESCSAAKGCEGAPVAVVMFLAGTIWEKRFPLCEQHKKLLAERLSGCVKPGAPLGAQPSASEVVFAGDRMSEKDAADRGLLCIAWGPLSSGMLDHPDCPVVVTEASQVIPRQAAKLGKLPAICLCDCTACKRAWWDMGQPTPKGDKIVTRSGREIA
jgi:hypothetical protein